MRRRLRDGLEQVHHRPSARHLNAARPPRDRRATAGWQVLIPGSAVNEWSTSWKKFMMELSHLRGYTLLYPNLPNQTSFSTNHLEAGEHIGAKANKLKHNPIDFTVPLVRDPDVLRALWWSEGGGWVGGAAGLRPLPPLHELPVLNHFSERSSQEALFAQGREAAGKRAAETPPAACQAEAPPEYTGLR